jgi:transcription antitermination factor NusG
MKTASFAVGDLVKVTSGIYADAVGVVSDVQPECSAVRIHAKDGNVYAYTDDIQKMPKAPARSIRPLLKK